MFLCLAIFCENFVTFQGWTIYYETLHQLLSLYSDREPDVLLPHWCHGNYLNCKQKLVKILEILTFWNNILHTSKATDIPGRPVHQAQVKQRPSAAKSTSSEWLQEISETLPFVKIGGLNNLSVRGWWQRHTEKVIKSTRCLTAWLLWLSLQSSQWATPDTCLPAQKRPLLFCSKARK